MVFIGAVTHRALEGKTVRSVSIRHRFGDLADDVVVGNENAATRLNSEHLQAKICKLYMVGFLPALKKFLVVSCSEAAGILRSQRIDTVQRKTGLPQPVREAHE